MTGHQLSRLQQLISRRLDRLLLELFPGPPPFRGAGPTFLSGTSRKRVEEEWTRLCSGMGISKGVGINISEDAGLERVSVFDPMPGGDWLEMDLETANKILLLGMP